MNKIILFLIINIFLYGQSIVMGYRTSERIPLINKEDNDGLYRDLYTEAFDRLGYDLEIVRLPKVRVLNELDKGNIDFYPGFTFTKERSEYVFFIENGLYNEDVILTRGEVDDFDSLNDLKGLRYARPLGGPEYFQEKFLEDIKVFEYPELNLEQIINLLIYNRADFLIYDYDSLRYYIKENNIIGLKFHKNLLNNKQVMYLGFSQKSKFFQSEINENYDKKKKITPENFPIKLKEGSLAYKLEKVLLEMKKDGFTDSLVNKYYNK